MVLDECFHGDTPIDTPSGPRKISDIRVGDVVFNFYGTGTVAGISRTPIVHPLELLIGGKRITCSANHRFMSPRGWVEASNLTIGDYICEDGKSLSGLWQEIRCGRLAVSSPQLHKMFQALLDEGDFKEDVQGVQEEVHGRMLPELDSCPGVLRPRVPIPTSQRPLQKGGGVASHEIGKREIEKVIEDKSHTREGRQWEDESHRGVSGEGPKEIWFQATIHRLGTETIQAPGMPESLQIGLREPSAHGMRGGGRGEPSIEEGACGGQEKTVRIKFTRVEGIKISEQGSVGGQKESYFYDLQVSGHPSYYVNGFLVHNCHNIKSQKAKRTEFIHRVVYENSIKRVSLLTGTPIRNRVSEFYSLLALCNYDPSKPESKFLASYPDQITFADHFSFREEYTMEVGRRLIQIVKWNGLKNVKELRGYLKDHYIRIKSADVLDLPPISYKSFLVSDLPDEDLKAAFDSYFEGEGTGSVNPTAKAQAALRKAPVTVKYAKDLLEEVDCVLIYSDHVEASGEIARAFNVPALNGKMPTSKRMEYAKRFQEGEGNVLVATIGALSEGVNLTRASHLIISDHPWVPGALKQVIYRIQRIGQKSNCTVHKIIGSPQDAQIIDTLEKKLETINKAT